MATNEVPESSGRETRLLVLIVVVSLAVLLLLARFRFPAATLTVAPPAPSPLANLAGRATFLDLAESISTLYGRTSSRIAVVRLEPQAPSDAPNGRGRGAGGESSGPPPAAVLVPALRVRGDLALVHVPPGLEVAALLGAIEPVDVVAADPKREVAIVRMPTAFDTRAEISDGFGGFAYLGAFTATASGPTVFPVFIGRTGLLEDSRWPAGLITVGEVALPAGAILFSVEGRLVGLAVRGEWGTAIVPPSVIDAVVAELTAAGGAS